MEDNLQNPQDYSQMMPDYSYYDPYAIRVSFGRRLGAYLIDYLIYSLILMILLFATGKFDEILSISNNGSLDLNAMLEISNSITPLALALSLIYYSLEAFIGATLGKLTLGIKIASVDQTPAPLSKLLIRYFVKNISTVLATLGLLVSLFSSIGSILGIIVFIGFFFILGKKRQGFHDMIAGTTVFYNEDIIQPKNDEL